MGETKVQLLRDRIIDEIFYALGLKRTGLARRLLGRLFYLPAVHFSQIAARFDDEAALSGLPGACHRVLPDFSMTVTARGVERIPAEGPLLVVCNHPGTFDSLALGSSIPRRDLKIFVSDVRFARALTSTSPYLFFVPADPAGRMTALRGAIDHLRSGGAALIFAQGQVEPDPAFMPGASEAIETWSSSLEIMLRKAPHTRLQVAIASHALLPRFRRSPIVRLRRKPYAQQKLAEFIQAIQQMVFPGSVRLNIRLSFAPPVCAAELATPMMPGIKGMGQRLLEEHQRVYLE